MKYLVTKALKTGQISARKVAEDITAVMSWSYKHHIVKETQRPIAQSQHSATSTSLRRTDHSDCVVSPFSEKDIQQGTAEWRGHWVARGALEQKSIWRENKCW